MRAGCLSDADALVFWRNVVMPNSYLGARDQAQVMKELERDVSLWDYVQCAVCTLRPERNCNVWKPPLRIVLISPCMVF